MVAFLEKSISSEGFHQVIDFLNRSHICYALTKKPDVYISFIKQFWRSAEATTDDNGEVQITATIDGHLTTLTEASLRRHLKLDDHDGITSIPNLKIFEQLALMRYRTDLDKLTFQKGAFSPQLRPTKGYSGQEVALFPTMLNVSEPSTSPSRITSSPSHSPEPSIEHSPDHTTAAVSFPSPTQPTQPSPGAEQHIPTPNEFGSSEKGNSEVSTVGETKGTASKVPVVSTIEVNISTAGRTITYRRRSEEERTRNDKGKAIMTEPEPKKKSKKELKQERLSLAEAIRLQEQMDEEQRAQIARDEEIAR
ncbi:hypothetical protein Tco_0604042 [Tanacetum coccineum]